MSNEDQVIAVMGPIGVGKSSFIYDSVPPSSRTEGKVGSGLQSEIKEVQPVSWVTEEGIRVELLDTPGCDESGAGLTGKEILEMIVHFLTKDQGKNSRLNGLIYVHRITDTREGGTTQRNLKMFQKMCGNDSLKNVVIITTMWDKIDAGQGSRHEQELISKDNLFKPLLDKGAVMRRYNRTPESAAGVINYLLGGSPTTQIVHEIAQEKMDPEDTPAGTNPHGEILALLQKQKEAIELLEAKMSHNRHLQTDTRHHDGEQVIAEMHALWQKHKEKMESLTVEIWRILQNAPNHQSGDKNTSNKEQVIAVMGPTGVGKSSFIHNAVPPDLRTEVKVGHSLRSETNKVQPVSWVNKDGKRVKLVDTPGFNDSRAGMSDVEVLKMIANFLVDECDEKKPRLTGLIYVHRISDPRVGGTALRNLRMFRKLCGKDSMKNVVIVTTMWDMVDKKEGERREQELKSSNDLFKPLLDDGAIMIGYDRTHECANRVVNRLLEKGPTTPQIVQEIVNKGVVLVDTAAGTELQSEIRELLKKHNDEMKSLKTEVRGLKQKVPEQERQRMNEEMQDRQRMEGVMTNLSMELDELKRGIPNDPPLNYEATDNFPPPDTKCIEDCSKLLRLVKECRSTLSPKPKYRDIANSVVSCTVDFADAVEKSLRSIQSASSTLKPVLKSQDAHSLQQFMRMDPHPKTFTQGTWTKAQHDMEMVTKDIEAILSKRGKIDKIQDGLKFNKKDKEKRIDALKETLKSTKEVITDMGAMVDWWIQVTGAIKYAEDAAPHKTGDASIAVGVMVALTRIIDAFDAYCEAYAACSKDLRNIAQGCSV